jgi:O-acetyl-ADP-ribose deacetylase (regulator of RNase III)
MLHISTGNLLDAEVDALVNTVNTEGVMGKGVALQFKKKFPEIYEPYRLACEAGEVRPGQMHVFTRDSLIGPRYIINFPTKRHWRSPSRLEDIASGLDALKQEISRLNIHSVALPPLGCGNGGLAWADVHRLIQEKLKSLEDVQIMIYPPSGSPDAASMAHHTPRPDMTPSRAIALKIWSRYLVLGYQLTLLEVHKLLYFLQEAGEPLKLRFEKQRYGPYADNLRHLLHRLEGHLILGFADGQNQPETQIELMPGSVQEADRFLNEQGDASAESLKRLERVEKLIEGYESPYGMELLATVHWAALHEKGNDYGLERVRRVINEWNPRKAELMKPEHVELAWKRLGEMGWLAQTV